MPADELRKTCEDLFAGITVTEKQAENVELLTRKQSKSKEWHRLRTGRITASVMKSVCATLIEKPALSTVQAICGQSKFKSKATEYGCKHEQDALHDYSEFMKTKHDNFSVVPCGLVLSTDYPFLGASPDGLTSCCCCGEGLVEIKCPYSARDSYLSTCNIECLKDGKLKTGHRYSYQIQTQLTVTGKEFCDFVIWTVKDLHVERVQSNEDLENEILEKSKHFFVKVVLPELTGSLVTREKNLLNASHQSAQVNSSDKETNAGSVTKYTPGRNNCTNVELVCVCGSKCLKASDRVVRCDSENCKYGLLHFKCVNVKRKPKAPYYCPECRKSKW